MKTIVEFFGEPGVGKSYVSDGLYERVNEESGSRVVKGGGAAISQMSRLAWTKVWLISTAVCRHPLLAVRVLSFVLASGIRRPDAVLRVWSNFIFLLAHIRMNLGRADTVILDQGFGQALWSTIVRATNEPNEAKASELLSSLARSSKADRIVIVWVDAPESLHRDRLQERADLGRQPSPDLLSSELSRLWSHATGAVNVVVTRCGQFDRGPWIEQIRFENDGDESRLAEFHDVMTEVIRDGRSLSSSRELFAALN